MRVEAYAWRGDDTASAAPREALVPCEAPFLR